MCPMLHHHHHVHEGLGVFPVPWSSRCSWSLHLFLGPPTFLCPFGLYCSACFGILFVSILCMCCSHFTWYCFISFTIFCAPVFSLIHCFFSLSSFVSMLHVWLNGWTNKPKQELRFFTFIFSPCMFTNFTYLTNSCTIYL